MIFLLAQCLVVDLEHRFEPDFATIHYLSLEGLIAVDQTQPLKVVTMDLVHQLVNIVYFQIKKTKL